MLLSKLLRDPARQLLPQGHIAHLELKAKIALLAVPLLQLAGEMVQSQKYLYCFLVANFVCLQAITFRQESKLSAIGIHSGNGVLSPLVVKVDLLYTV